MRLSIMKIKHVMWYNRQGSNNVTLKNVMKMIDCENAIIMIARKVVKPPLNTAGPMVSIA